MVLSRLLVLEPGFSVREAMRRSPFARPEDIARFAEGLRRAGLRENHEPCWSMRPVSSSVIQSLILSPRHRTVRSSVRNEFASTGRPLNGTTG